MRLTVPYTYFTEEIPPRCRKPRLVEKQSQTTLFVDEVDVGTLKLAFVVRDYKDEFVIRSYKDKLYKVKMRKDEEGTEEPMMPEHLEKILEKLPSRIYGTKTQQEVVDEMTEFVERFVISGNIVYEVTTEPRYCIYTFGLGHNHGGTALSVDYRFNDNIANTRYFDALHYKEAVHAATQIAYGRGDDESVPHFENGWHYIEVVDPACVKCDPKTHGNGNDFINQLENIVENSGSQAEAATNVILASMLK